MSINGKYESYEAETFIIQLSMKDLVDLNILFRNQQIADNALIEPRDEAKKFIEMIHQATATNAIEFGFDYFHIDK